MNEKPRQNDGKEALSTSEKITKFATELLANAPVIGPSIMASGRIAKVLSILREKPAGEPNSVLDGFFASTKKHFEDPSLLYDYLRHQKRRFENQSPEYANNDDETIVFLPWNTSVKEAKRYGLIPKWGNVTVFTTPPGFVNCDPQKTKQIFLNVIQDAKGEIDKILAKSPNQKINVISYSAANGAGFYTMNNLLKKDNQGSFVSVVTGRGLGEEVFNSQTLKNIKADAMKMGISSGEKYNEAFYEEGLGLLLPMYNCDNLPDSTTFFIGDEDDFIPPAYGMDMASRAKEANPNIKINRYPFGHIGTMLYVAHMENLKRMNSVQKISEELTEETVNKYQNMFEKRNLKLPREDVRIWASAFTILCSSVESFKGSVLIKEDTEHRTIREIASDFLSAILPEAYKTVVSPIIKGASRALRGSRLTNPQ